MSFIESLRVSGCQAAKTAWNYSFGSKSTIESSGKNMRSLERTLTYIDMLAPLGELVLPGGSIIPRIASMNGSSGVMLGTDAKYGVVQTVRSASMLAITVGVLTAAAAYDLSPALTSAAVAIPTVLGSLRDLRDLAASYVRE